MGCRFKSTKVICSRGYSTDANKGKENECKKVFVHHKRHSKTSTELCWVKQNHPPPKKLPKIYTYSNRVQVPTMFNFVMLACYRHSPPYATVTSRNIRRKSRNIRRESRNIRRKLHLAQVGIGTTYGLLYMYIQRSPIEVRIPTQRKPTAHNITACVIAQQYSSDFFSMFFNIHKKKIA